MGVRLWGVRGSVPVPGRSTERYGGITCCVQVAAADGSQLVLDAGHGDQGPRDEDRRALPAVDLLTYLHLDRGTTLGYRLRENGASLCDLRTTSPRSGHDPTSGQTG